MSKNTPFLRDCKDIQTCFNTKIIYKNLIRTDNPYLRCEDKI